MRGYNKKISGDGIETVYLFMTRSKKNRRFAHPPNACLEGEGYNLANEDIFDLSINKELIPCNRMLFTRGGNGEMDQKELHKNIQEKFGKYNCIIDNDIQFE